MRVIAGKARSLKLKTPEGLETRPTTDRIKETLFNMLQPWLPDSIFIDLFSGSGGIGIEALSRGARHAYFVENNKNAIACIQENLQFTKTMDDATILKQDVLSALSGIHEKEADVIFIDPPYEQGSAADACASGRPALCNGEYAARCGSPEGNGFFLCGETWVYHNKREML